MRMICTLVKEMKYIKYSLNILKHNLPIETLGGPPPPKGDPVFELKQLPNTLKYAYLDEKKIYLLLSVLTFQNVKKKDY